MRNEFFTTFLRIGLYSFGGPAAQIALMHRVLVDEKEWLSERTFLSALSFCMLLPGPEAMQLATYAGWRRAGIPGGLTAGLLFVVPGAIVMAALATIYVLFGTFSLVGAVFLGVQATVVAIVIQALLKVSRKALKGRSDWAIAALSFAGIFFLVLPFPLIIGLAALWGFFRAPDTALSETLPSVVVPSPAKTLATIMLWLVVWAAPIALLALSDAQLLVDIALFFSRLAVVTFGGAYAVLAYMAQTVVGSFGWITTQEMIDGLGLAETTPGPLILVTEFVGFLAGYHSGGLGRAFAAALVTLWVTFTPCFLWIFAGAPYVERLIGMPRLARALASITAAVVGVILNLSIWFGLHVFFSETGNLHAGPVAFLFPDLASFDPIAGGIALLSALLLLRLKAGIGKTLFLGAGLGALSAFVLT